MSKDYVADAIAVLSNPPGDSAPAEQQAAPPTQAQVAEAPKSEAVQEVESTRKSFADIAKELAAKRAEEASAAPMRALETRLGPQGMHNLTQAVMRNDNAAILKALGVSLTELQFEQTKEALQNDEEKPQTPSEVVALREKLEALERQLSEEKIAVGRARTIDMAGELAKKNGFEELAEDPELVQKAVGYVEAFIREHNAWPAKTREESILMGLQEVNEEYLAQKERWRARLSKGLTSGQESDKNVARGLVQGSPASREVGRTLSNNVISGPKGADATTKPKSESDYRAAAIAALSSVNN